MTGTQSGACRSNCRITVVGHLDGHWSDWFDGFTLVNQPEGSTVLSGAVCDQAALFGVLLKVRDLGLSLVSVQVEE